MINCCNLYKGRFSQWLCSLWLLMLIGVAQAHPPGLSSAEYTFTPDELKSNLTFSIQDIEAFVPMDSNLDAEVTPDEMTAAKPAIAELIQRELKLTIDNESPKLADPGAVEFDEQNNAHINFRYLIQPSTKPKLVIQAEFLSKFASGHKHFVTIKDASGHLVGEKMLSRQDNQMTQDIIATEESQTGDYPVHTPTHSASFVEFLKLGIEHILTGYDHLLFLFSLLVITHSFWPALKIITFFTIAHSITLALASLNLVELSSSIVEPLIAATIIYVGVENIIRGDHPKGRGLLTFFFGLIHGFGFAGVLREMGISTSGNDIIVPLFSFNLGVEIGQITVAAITLPIIWWLHTKPAIQQRLTPVCSILACLAGGYWLVERTLLS